MTINFLKMHGLGNDFVILDGRKEDFPDKEKLSQKVADRHFGAGCDQVIFLSSTNKADIRMEIFNPDGSEAGMCGNAARCVGDIVLKEKQTGTITIETKFYILSAVRAEQGQVTVDMGEPRLDWQQIPLAREEDTRFVPIMLPTSSDVEDSENYPVCVSMGNPHCVFFVGGKIESFPVSEIGPIIEAHEIFPQKTNVEFVHIKDRSTIRMRVWERGTGVTLACGSGACGAAVASMRRSYVDRKITVEMDGGNLLIEWNESNNHVYMTGPVAYVFSGQFNE